MATYIVLSSFTEQGIRDVRSTTKRADAVKAQLAARYALSGVVCVVDAPAFDHHGETALQRCVHLREVLERREQHEHRGEKGNEAAHGGFVGGRLAADHHHDHGRGMHDTCGDGADELEQR